MPAGASTDQRIAILQRAARDGLVGAEGYASLGDAYLAEGPRERRSRLLLTRRTQLRRRAPPRRRQRGRRARGRHAGRAASRLPRAAAPGHRGAPARARAGRPSRDRRRADRARPLRRRRANDPAHARRQAEPGLLRARVLPSASCPATPPARSRRCGWRSPPAGRPRTWPTSRCCWATSSSSAAASARRGWRTPRRCGRCRATRPEWLDSHELTRRAAIWGEPPPACVGPPSGCR